MELADIMEKYKPPEKLAYQCPRCKKRFTKKYKEVGQELRIYRGIKCPRCKLVNYYPPILRRKDK